MIKIGLTDYTPENKIIDVRDKNQVIKAKYAIGKDDILKYTLMNEHYIEISFELNRNATFKRSDYIEWEGEKYTLREDYQPEQVNKRKYKYTLKFEAIEMFFQDIQYYYLNQGLKESEWRLTGNPEYFIKIAVDNVNRYFGTTDFKVGTIEPTEIKDITFEVNTNTFNALTQVADDYGAEWYITGKTIHLLNKVSFGDEVDFETEVSVLSMKREKGEGSVGYTRIVALGSTRNIPNNYRGSSNNEAVDAIYPKRLRIPTSKGDVIDAYPNMSPDEVVEGTVIFDEVYPKRIGTIEAVGTIEYQDVNEDTSEVSKWNAYKFKDSGINFKEEYMLPGQELKLQFVSGDLNGRDFALKFHPKGFSSSDNSQFYEIYRTDEFGKLLPNDVMKPKTGDKYVLYGFNIALVSDQYVPAGELELYDVATTWQQKQLRDTGVYECPTVIKHFKDNQMDLAIGQKVRLIKDIGNSRNLIRNSKLLFTGSWGGGFLKMSNKGDYLRFDSLGNRADAHAYFSDDLSGTYTTQSLIIGQEYILSADIRTNAKQYRAGFRKNPAPQIFYDIKDTPVRDTWFRHTQKIVIDSREWTGLLWLVGINDVVSTEFYVEVKNWKLEKGNKATDWTPAPEDVNAIRSSRIMGFEKKLNNKFDAIYTVGDNSTYSRFGKIEQQIKELQVAGIVYENTGGSGVYVIKQFDTTRPTDFNVYSAIASDAKYFNKQTGGTIQDDTTFAKNMQVQGTAIGDVFQNSTFTAGQFGSGYQIKRDANGQSYMEVDNILVRREAVFNRLTIAEIKSVGGTILLSLANMVLSKVEVKASTWKCFFDTADGTIPNDFAIGDQAICRKFTGKGIKYYWALVTAIGTDYIELSKTDKDGSGVPTIGDEVVQLGNRNDINRQYAIMLSAYGSTAPSINQYAGINSYDLTGKEVTAISPKGNKFTGSFTVSTNGTTAPIYKERGAFLNGTVYYLNDRVSYLGSHWVCIVNSTITTPSEGSSTWRKETAGQNDINNAINNIQVGSRNYMGMLSTNYRPTGILCEFINNYHVKFGNTTIGGTSTPFVFFDNVYLKEIGTYTLSFYAKKNNEENITLRAGLRYSGSSDFNVELSNDWQLITKKVEITSVSSVSLILFSYENVSLKYSIEVKDIKLEKGNKATDWTPAPEDIEKQIQDAENKANQAQVDADKANSVISDIANDNKLTPNEKQIIAKDWGDIQKEYPSAISEANKFGISTTAYTTAYNALNIYITPLLADLTTTNDIVGTTFRLRFNTYRDEYVKLLNAIASKTKDLADSAQTTANQAKTDASNAQSAANKAQTDANTANNLLTDIASDNKLTPNEKQETKKEWDAIVSEYPKNIAQANKFGVSATVYTNAYNALNSYITPLLANLGTTSDINGTTFRANFKAYYDARTDLLNAISTKAKDLADNAQTSANNAQKEAEKVRTEYKADFVVLDTKIASKVSQTDFNALGNRVSTSESNITQLSNKITSVVETVENIKVGGRNIFLESATIKTYNKGSDSGNGGSSSENVEDNIKFTRITPVKDGNFYFYPKLAIFPLDIKTGDVYTVSFEYRHNNSKNLGLYNYLFKGGTSAEVLPASEWTVFTITQEFTASKKVTAYQLFGFNSLVAGSNVDIRNLKLEKGNKSTDWTPAPEDADKAIQEADSKATQAQNAANQAQTDASNAQSAANKAQTDANTANNLLTDIASDNKLTPNEKQETKKEWDAIVSEYPKNIAQANKFGVSATVYTNAYNALNSYITPLLANLGTTSDINGTTFRANFKAYYDARTDLLNAISTKAKDLADSAQTSANNAQNTANLKNRTYYQDAVPTAPSGGHKVGDLWYKIALVDSSGNINADTSKNIYQLQYRWDGTTWRQINWSVSKSKIEQTDSSISLIVEKTGINSVGAGSSLYSLINQTAEEIRLEVSSISVGGRNLIRNSKLLFTGGWGGGFLKMSNKGDYLRFDSLGNRADAHAYFSDDLSGTYTTQPLVIGQEYILSADIRTNAKQYRAGFRKNPATQIFYDIKDTPVKDTWFRHTQKIVIDSREWTGLLWLVGINDIVSTEFYVEVKNWKLEKGNKATDWTPAQEDTQAQIDGKTTMDEVSSSLTITDNKISLASKTIELTGHTIAKSIEAQDLKVGSRTGLSALEVLKDGTFYAKGSKSSNSALIIDSGTQSIEIISPYSATCNPSGGSPGSSTGKSTVSISSQSGGVRVSNDNYDTSIVSTNGLFANKAGQSMYPSSSGITAKASVVGLGNGSVYEDYSGINFVAGVYGRASNSSTAPAFGGYFDMLRANGFVMSMIDISASTDKYTSITRGTSFVLGNSNVMQTVYLPSDAYKGTVIWLKQWWTGYMRIRPRGTQRLFDDSSQNDYIDVGEGWTAMCVFIGNWGSGGTTYGTWMISKFKF